MEIININGIEIPLEKISFITILPDKYPYVSLDIVIGDCIRMNVVHVEEKEADRIVKIFRYFKNYVDIK